MKIKIWWLLFLDAVAIITFTFGLILPHDENLTLMGYIGLFLSIGLFIFLEWFNYYLWKKQIKKG